MIVGRRVDPEGVLIHVTVTVQLLEGAEKGYEEAISQLGQSGRMIPKRAILVVVPDELVDRTVKTIIQVNQTRKSGDGKIFVMPLERCIRIRTGEEGSEAIG